MSTELGNFLRVIYEQASGFVKPCVTARIVESSVEAVLSLRFHLNDDLYSAAWTEGTTISVTDFFLRLQELESLESSLLNAFHFVPHVLQWYLF